MRRGDRDSVTLGGGNAAAVLREPRRKKKATRKRRTEGKREEGVEQKRLEPGGFPVIRRASDNPLRETAKKKRTGQRDPK